jgi:hypothetical protein
MDTPNCTLAAHEIRRWRFTTMLEDESVRSPAEIVAAYEPRLKKEYRNEEKATIALFRLPEGTEPEQVQAAISDLERLRQSISALRSLYSREMAYAIWRAEQ